MEYKKVKLKDVVTVLGDGIHGTPKYSENGEYYFINGNNLSNGKILIKPDTKKVDNEEYKKYKKDLNNRTLMVSINGTLGNVAVYNNEKCILGKSACYFNVKDNVNKQYIKYILYAKEFQKYIQDYATGTTIKNMSLKAMREYEFLLPELNIQNKIDKVLSHIDEKIELNNKINDNLYEVLKMEFKTKFYNKNNDAKLLDYISNTIGGDWGKELPVDNYNTKVYCVRGADIPNMEYGNKGNAPTRYILEKNFNKKKLEPNDIIIEISGGSPTQSTGRTAYITGNILSMYDAPLLCTNFCRAIETKKEIYAPFVYMYLTLMYEDDIFFNWENGTTGIKNLALNDLLLNIEITQPNEGELNNYYILFNSIMNKISNNSNENIKLELLRNTLLPKLMNGELDLDKMGI